MSIFYGTITLGWNDTYTVRFFTYSSGTLKVKETITDIYFDVLVETIDNKIETIGFK